MSSRFEVKWIAWVLAQPDHDHVIGRLAVSFDLLVFEVEAEIHADLEREAGLPPAGFGAAMLADGLGQVDPRERAELVEHVEAER